MTPEDQLPDIDRYREDVKNFVVGILLSAVQPYATIITVKVANAVGNPGGIATAFSFSGVDWIAGAALAVPAVLLFIKGTRIPTKPHVQAMRFTSEVQKRMTSEQIADVNATIEMKDAVRKEEERR